MSLAAMETRTVARPKGRPKTSDRNDVSVKVDKTLIGMAKLVATHRGVSLAELLSGMLDEPIRAGYGQMLRELGPPSGKAPKGGASKN